MRICAIRTAICAIRTARCAIRTVICAIRTARCAIRTAIPLDYRVKELLLTEPHKKRCVFPSSL